MRVTDVAGLALENRGRMLFNVLRSKRAWWLALRALSGRPWLMAGALAIAAGGYFWRRRSVAA